MGRIWGFVLALMFVLFNNTVYALPVDVAQLYGTATANQSYSTQTADLAIDGIFSGRSSWVAPDQGTMLNPNWLTVDLGSNFNVTSIDLLWQPSDNQFYGYTTNYDLYYGSDNTNWTLAESGQFVDETSLITANIDFSDIGADMRYVKYVVDGGTHWSAISELKVWSDDGSSPVNPVPEPATVLLLGAGMVGILRTRLRRNR